MTAASRARFADAVRAEPVDVGLAALLIGAEVDPDLDVDTWLAVLDGFAAAARPLVPLGGSPSVAAEGLRIALGERAGFAGSGEDYADVRSSLLHEVLRRRRGLPILLTLVWAEVARRLDVPAYPVALPGHVVLGIGDPDVERVHVDPFHGGVLVADEVLSERVRMVTGESLLPAHLRPADPEAILLRLLTNVRALTARQPPGLEAARTRLWAVELSLLLPHHPAELRRERGELLVRLGDHLGGAAELESHAALLEVADPAAAEAVRREARAARARLN